MLYIILDMTQMFSSQFTIYKNIRHTKHVPNYDLDLQRASNKRVIGLQNMNQSLLLQVVQTWKWKRMQ